MLPTETDVPSLARNLWLKLLCGRANFLAIVMRTEATFAPHLVNKAHSPL